MARRPPLGKIGKIAYRATSGTYRYNRYRQGMSRKSAFRSTAGSFRSAGRIARGYRYSKPRVSSFQQANRSIERTLRRQAAFRKATPYAAGAAALAGGAYAANRYRKRRRTRRNYKGQFAGSY